MASSEYYLEQAARCRRLAARVLDKELQQRLLELAEDYDRKAAAPPRDDCNGRLKFGGGFDRAEGGDL